MAVNNPSHMSRLAYPAAIHLIWGLVLIALFVAGTMVQVQTSEAWFLHSSDPAAWVPNFNLFLQFSDFWNARMDAAHVGAFLYAWGVQAILVTQKIGLIRVQVQVMKKHGANMAHDSIAKSAKWRGGLWDVVSGLLIVWNCITDFMYMGGLGFLQQVGFTVVMFLTTFYSGTHGIQNVAGALGDMSK